MNSDYIIKNLKKAKSQTKDFENNFIINLPKYGTIINAINTKTTNELLELINELKNKDKELTKGFISHILNPGIISDKFFELDNTFGPTNNNIIKLINNNKEEDFEDFEKNIDYNSKLLDRQFKMSFNNNNSFLSSIKNDSYDKKIEDFYLNKLDNNLKNFVDNVIPNLTDEDFGNFMFLLTKKRGKI
jgi:hypothetical protein